MVLTDIRKTAELIDKFNLACPIYCTCLIALCSIIIIASGISGRYPDAQSLFAILFSTIFNVDLYFPQALTDFPIQQFIT